MSKIVTDSQHYSNIADAIRYKTARTDTFLPSEMPDAIKQIKKDSPIEDGVYWLFKPYYTLADDGVFSKDYMRIESLSYYSNLSKWIITDEYLKGERCSEWQVVGNYGMIKKSSGYTKLKIELSADGHMYSKPDGWFHVTIRLCDAPATSYKDNPVTYVANRGEIDADDKQNISRQIITLNFSNYSETTDLYIVLQSAYCDSYIYRMWLEK